MIIKKFTALNEQDAIILAKEELGKNVIIMNSKKITPKGLARLFKKSKIEITAAIDDEKSYDSEEDMTKETLKIQLEQKNVEDKKTKEKKAKEKKTKQKKTKESKAKKANSDIDTIEKTSDKKADIVDDKAKKALEEIAKAAKELEKTSAIAKQNNSKLDGSKVDNSKVNKLKEDRDNTKDISIQNIQALLEEKSRELESMTKSIDTVKKEKTIDAKELQSKIKKEVIEAKKEIRDEVKKEVRKELQKEMKTESNLEHEALAKADAKPVKEDKSDKYVKLIKKQLLKHEVDEQYIDMIIDEVKGSIKKDTIVDNILASVYQKIILKLGTPSLIEPGENHPKYIFFMGPTGVGKTTTIAKIASDFKLNRKLNVALLTSDTYRIAAVEQLRIYANILKVPINIAYSAEDIQKLKPQLERYDIVLIDTAGRSHKNKEQGDDLRELLSTIDKSERDAYLVLSATTKYSDLKAIVEAYSDIEDYKLLFTKTDETTHLGNILNIKLLTKAKLSYIANGQDVPTDIGKVDAQELAKQLLGGGM